ncbi:CapA family protein [Microvirga sp. 2YAF29]|uniref:CapA family protein n=1 Tax=Microvirga sp. 2YAF29 TaxID=3233031 RepID=UPI003F9748A9
MTTGLVYIWEASGTEFTGGKLRTGTIELTHLRPATKKQTGLRGRYVDVFNFNDVSRSTEAGAAGSSKSEQAEPGEFIDYMFEPCSGGLVGGVEERLSASRFAEVNAYYHITLMAERIDNVLTQLRKKALPKIQALVNAHETGQGGAKENRHAQPNRISPKPVSGVAYRYPVKSIDDPTEMSIPRYGQLEFGPGSTWTDKGWLSRISGGTYLCNPAHIAGFIYQGYGRHVVRHVADIQADGLSAPRAQPSRASALEAALTSYLSASMLSTPHIWCWHRHYGPEYSDAESLSHNLHMNDVGAFMTRSDAFATRVLSGCLWDLHKKLSADGIDCLKLVIAALYELGRLTDNPFDPDVSQTFRIRSSAENFASCMVHAARETFGPHCERIVLDVLSNRGLKFEPLILRKLTAPSVPGDDVLSSASEEVEFHITRIRTQFEDAIIPDDGDFLGPDKLARHISGSNAPYDLSAVGDVMPGMRMRHRIRKFGEGYPFAWVKPILDSSSVVTGNLEGPFSKKSEKLETTRNFSYQVNPKLVSVLDHGGFNAMTIANNHIQDCGRGGVVETIDALDKYHIQTYGGGRNERTAHRPAIWDGTRNRIGLLGYYWNGRTAARGDLPGSARDLSHLVQRDMALLRPLVDRIVVMVHWGIPYERSPLEDDRAKARRFIDLGADVVVGHHPHILQPLEIYKGRPILYSVGNFAFGSGNSKAESILPSIRFQQSSIEMDIFPVYVQNRDPRLNYQPKVIGGESGTATIDRLLSMSPGLECEVERHDYCLRLSISDTKSMVG